jgi:hypothetical protein
MNTWWIGHVKHIFIQFNIFNSRVDFFYIKKDGFKGLDV